MATGERPLTELLDRFGSLERWSADPDNFRPCAGCGEELSNLLQGSDGAYRCDPCEAQRLAVLRIARDRGRALGYLANVPGRFAATAFQELLAWPVDKKAPKLDLREWRGAPWSVFLWGNVGNGKTTLAVELLYRAMLRGETARYVRAADVSGLHYEGGPEAKARLVVPRLLLLDDLGAGHPRGGWEAVADLVDARWASPRPTLVTSNRNLEMIAVEGGPHGTRIADRLTDGLVVQLAGGSRRGFGG